MVGGVGTESGRVDIRGRTKLQCNVRNNSSGNNSN